MNRKHPIKISEGVEYIPDIICTDQNGVKTYIEYELVNHTQVNFNAKCNKMTKVTSVLNFIVPNINKIGKIKEKVEAWMKQRGMKSLSHITVRITSAVQVAGKDMRDNKNWKTVYMPGKRAEPYTNF